MTCRAPDTMPGGVGVPTLRCTASDEGEVYMICQGTGGGYGDVLERDPEAPPKPLPYYGSWGDDNTVIHATTWTTRGPARVAASMSQLPQIFPPDQNVLAIAAQQARIAEREARIVELEQR